MDGGRKKWIDEGREMTREKSHFAAGSYEPQARADYKIRAFRDQVLAHIAPANPS